MTANQINYARVLEDTRHNYETERQGRRNLRILKSQADSAARQATVAEQRAQEEARSNKAKEQVNWYNALETYRHNASTEDVAKFNAHITNERYTQEATHWQRMDDISEKNAESQRISALANSMQAKAAQTSASASMVSAQASAKQAETARLRQIEDARHNATSEAQARTAYSETVMHNRNMEDIQNKIWISDAAHMQRQDYVSERNADTNRIGVWTGLAGSLIRSFS